MSRNVFERLFEAWVGGLRGALLGHNGAEYTRTTVPDGRNCYMVRSVPPRVAITTHGTMPSRNEWALSALGKQSVAHSPFPVRDRLSRAQLRVWLRPRSFAALSRRPLCVLHTDSGGITQPLVIQNDSGLSQELSSYGRKLVTA
jgi:hypothetical protein